MLLLLLLAEEIYMPVWISRRAIESDWDSRLLFCKMCFHFETFSLLSYLHFAIILLVYTVRVHWICIYKFSTGSGWHISNNHFYFGFCVRYDWKKRNMRMWRPSKTIQFYESGWIFYSSLSNIISSMIMQSWNAVNVMDGDEIEKCKSIFQIYGILYIFTYLQITDSPFTFDMFIYCSVYSGKIIFTR